MPTMALSSITPPLRAVQRVFFCASVSLQYGVKTGMSYFSAFLTTRSLNQLILSPRQQATAPS